MRCSTHTDTSPRHTPVNLYLYDPIKKSFPTTHHVTPTHHPTPVPNPVSTPDTPTQIFVLSPRSPDSPRIPDDSAP